MKTTNLILAILYTLLVVPLFILSFSATIIQKHPYRPATVVFLSAPIVLNWLSFAVWNNAVSKIKIANLVIASIYTILLVILAVPAVLLGDRNLFLGIFVFAVPVFANWLSYSYWPPVSPKETH